MRRLWIPVAAILLWAALSMPTCGTGRDRPSHDPTQTLCSLLEVILERDHLPERIRRILQEKYDRFCAAPFHPGDRHI